MTCFMKQARRGSIDAAVAQEILGRPLSYMAVRIELPQELLAAFKLKQTDPSLSARETAVVMATVPTLLRPVAERGAAGRLDVWRRG
jgi:hypothetical protein